MNFSTYDLYYDMQLSDDHPHTAGDCYMDRTPPRLARYTTEELRDLEGSNPDVNECPATGPGSQENPEKLLQSRS